MGRGFWRNPLPGSIPGSDLLHAFNQYRFVQDRPGLPRRPDPLADAGRHAADRRDRDRGNAHGRQFPRAGAAQQRTRVGKHRAAAGPPLRSAAPGFRGRAKGPDHVHAVQRDRHGGELQASDVHRGNPSDAQVQDGRAVLCRRHQRLRRRRQADQRVGHLAGAIGQRRGPRLLQNLPVRPALAANGGRAGLQPHHRHVDHGDRTQGHRTEG